MTPRPEGPVGFVLGGGGVLGAAEAGMLRALLEAGVLPDLVVGTSVGAINGAAIAADPTIAATERLVDVWRHIAAAGLFGGRLWERAWTLLRTRTHLHHEQPLRALLADRLAGPAGTALRIEQLPVRFQCVAASIERAAEHWFTDGPLIDAVLASAAVPGVFAPVELGGEHYLDGGLVNSIPIARAVALGARTLFVLQVGRIERALDPPRFPWEVALVAFEIARRHRFHHDMANLPQGVTAHVLPTGLDTQPRYADLSNLRYWDVGRIGDRADRAYQATRDYVAGLAAPS
jgi:NTE family protein